MKINVDAYAVMDTGLKAVLDDWIGAHTPPLPELVTELEALDDHPPAVKATVFRMGGAEKPRYETVVVPNLKLIDLSEWIRCNDCNEVHRKDDYDHRDCYPGEWKELWPTD